MKKNFVRIIGCILILTLLISQISLGFAVSANPLNDPNTVPAPEYKYNVITTRDVDLKGGRTNTADERFFVWGEYQFAFSDFIMNPYDISKADYIEFDFYSDVDTSFQISVGSCSTTRNPIYNNFFEFYDIRSNRKSVSVKAGWNHVVIEAGGEFLVQDPTTTYPGTYDYHAVDGIVLHGPESNYIRLTNIALTSTDAVVPDEEEPSTEILEKDDFGNLDEDLNKLKEFFVLLIRVIFILEDNNIDSGDVNSDNSVDMIDIIIIKNKILEIIDVDY